MSLKNLRRNKLRNLFAMMRIGIGVIILLILISSGLGLNTFLKQANSYHLTSNETIVTTVTDQINSFLGTSLSNSMVVSRLQKAINSIVYIVDGIASIVFLVGILDIINTMGFNLNERKREIGILKSFGFSNKKLLISLSLESGLLGFFGSLGGVIVGSLGLFIVANIIGIPISILIPLWLVVGIIIITTILSMILGLFPAWFAVNQDIREALDT